MLYIDTILTVILEKWQNSDGNSQLSCYASNFGVRHDLSATQKCDTRAPGVSVTMVEVTRASSFAAKLQYATTAENA